jgi:hypothetical protein
MSMPTIGEQRFQAQLIHALNEIADSIQENTKATRELAGVLREIRGDAPMDIARARRPAPPSPPPGEPGE